MDVPGTSPGRLINQNKFYTKYQKYSHFELSKKIMNINYSLIFRVWKEK